MSSSGSLPRFARFNPSGHILPWNKWLGIAAVVCALLALQVAWTAPSGSIRPWQLVLGWVVAMGLLCLYRLGINKELEDRKRNEPRSPVDIDHCFLVENCEMWRIKYRFSTRAVDPKDGHIKIHWISRRALVFLAAPELGVLVAGITVLAVAIRAHIEPQLLVLLLEGWFLAILAAWLWWNSYFFIISRDLVEVIRDYPPWLWWYPDHPFSLLLSKCDTLHLKRSIFGRMFNQGSIESDSNADNDQVFNHVWGIPEPNLCRQVATDAIIFASQRVTIEASVESWNRSPHNIEVQPPPQPTAGQSTQREVPGNRKPPPYRPW